jgi:hypothetical protein
VQIFENVPAGERPGLNFPVRRGTNEAELDAWRNAQTLSHVALGVPDDRILVTADRTAPTVLLIVRNSVLSSS